jgi:hypothetical protein
MIPDDLRGALAEEAHGRGISIGALIRQALVRELRRSPTENDAYLADTRVFAGDAPRKVAEEHDRYLYDVKP